MKTFILLNNRLVIQRSNWEAIISAVIAHLLRSAKVFGFDVGKVGVFEEPHERGYPVVSENSNRR
jgi:hypothetical protein